MMRKSLKNKILYVMICFCLLMFSCLMLSLNASNAHAQSGFVMVAGANVKMDNPSGIRYQATISADVYDSQAEYGVLIVPTDYLTNNSITDDYFDKLEGVGFTKDKLTVASSAPIKQADGSYVLIGSIVNIYKSNFNRNFTGIAFSFKDGDYTYATANDNSRSIMQVASRYLTDTVEPPSDDEKSTLLDMIGGKRASDENVNFALNENGDYVSKIKFDAFLPTPDDNFTVALMPKETADYAKFTLSTSSSFEGVVRADLGNDWYSFTFDTQMITDYNTVNGTRSDVITSIDITNASENVIIANVRNSILEIAKYSDSYVGSANYLATEMSDAYDYDGDNYSLKVTAKAVAYGAVDGSGATGRMANLAVYLPYGSSMPTTSVTVTWKTKIDRNSFVDCDDTQGANFSNLNTNSANFIKAAMLSVDTAAYSAHPNSTISLPSAEVNGWYNYTLTISESELSTFFVQGTDGNYYLRLVCINTVPPLSNGQGTGSWAAASTMGYDFYVDELKFTAN